MMRVRLGRRTRVLFLADKEKESDHLQHGSNGDAQGQYGHRCTSRCC